MTAMRDRLIDGALQIERTRLNGDRTKRLPGTSTCALRASRGVLVAAAGLKRRMRFVRLGLYVQFLDPSHVLLTISLPHEIAHGSLRLSFSDQNTEEDVDYILEVLPALWNGCTP
ncbi:MAG: hypothetical protein ACLS8R_02710 [Anaeromassilibacillus sp.]